MQHSIHNLTFANGAMALLPAALFLAVSISVPFDLGLVVLLLSIAFVLTMRPFPNRPLRRSDGLVALAGAAYLLVASLGIEPARSLVLGYPMLIGLALYTLISRIRFGGAELRVLAMSSAVLSLLFSVWLLCAAAPGTAPQQRVDAAGNLLLVVPNDAVLITFLNVLSTPLAKSRCAWNRSLFWAGWGLALVLGFVLESRGVLLVSALAVVGWVALEHGRSRWSVVGLAAGVMALLALDFLLSGPFSTKYQGWWDARIPLWQSAWTQFTHAPILGHGPGSFGLLHAPVEDGSGRIVDHRVSPWPHNLPLELLAGGGLVLALPFLFLLVHALTVLARSGPLIPGARTVGLLGMGVLVLVSLFEASLLRVWFTLSLFTLLGFLNALEAIHERSPVDRPSGERSDHRCSGDHLRSLRT